ALAALLSQPAGAGPLPMILATTTLKLANLSLLGQAALSGSVAPKAAILARGMLQAMLLTKLKITVVVLLATTLIAAGGGALVQQAIAEKPEDQGNRLLTGAQPTQGAEATVEVRGRDEKPQRPVLAVRGTVLMPDGSVAKD